MISTGLVVSVILTGSILVSGGTPLRLDYVALYVTDLPGDFTKLEVRFEAIRVGEGGSELVIHAPSVDLAAHVGPSQSVLVAEGWVPEGDESKFDLQFAGARGLRADEWMDLSLDTPWLRLDHDLARPASGRGAFLLDFNLEDSIVPVADETGEASSFRFVPVVAKVYVHDVAAALESASQAPGGPSLAGAPAFSEDDSREPVAQVASDEAPTVVSGEAKRPWYEEEVEGDYIVVQPEGSSVGSNSADDEPDPTAGGDETTPSPTSGNGGPTNSPTPSASSSPTTSPTPTVKVAVPAKAPAATTPTTPPTTSSTPTIPSVPTTTPDLPVSVV